jgi:hypothetical protein
LTYTLRIGGDFHEFSTKPFRQSTDVNLHHSLGGEKHVSQSQDLGIVVGVADGFHAGGRLPAGCY